MSHSIPVMLNMESGAAHLDESLEAFIFGMQVFVQIDRFIVATAELPVNFLHAISTAV